jgi:hypothetical protein
MLYPNPAGQVVQIRDVQHRTGTLEVLDLMGKIMVSQPFIGDKILDIAHLIPGFYHIVIRHEQGESRQVLIKK